MQIFDVIISFELRTIQQKTVKPTYLCPLGARKLAEGKGMRVNSSKQLLLSRELERDDYIENLHVLSCFILLKSVLLISCVFWIFFQNAGSQLCFRFFFFKPIELDRSCYHSEILISRLNSIRETA